MWAWHPRQKYQVVSVGIRVEWNRSLSLHKQCRPSLL
jgi:hypothetical protein